MSEWKPYIIEQLKADHKTAISIGPFGSRMKSDCYQNSGIPVIRGNNITDLPGFFGEFVFISEEKAQELESSRVYKGDLVFPHRGNIGEVGIVTGHQHDEYVMSTSLMKLTCNEEIALPWFLYYFFKSNQGRRKLLENASQVGTPGIATPLASLKSIKVFLPKIDEQEQIVDILFHLDRKIENLRRQNETLERIAQTLFKHWFVDFEFPNADGKPYKSSGGAMVRSELGEIPVGWCVGTLEECLENLIDNRGKTPEFFDSGIPALSAKFVKGGDLVNRDSFNYVSYELFDQSEKLEVGDVILTSEAPLGETYFIARETRYYPAQRVFALRANPEVVSSSYLNYWLSSSMGQFSLKRRASGSTVQGIKQSELYQCEVIIPNKEIQDLASVALTTILIKKEMDSDQMQTLTKTRDALLPKLMSGQLRIGG